MKNNWSFVLKLVGLVLALTAVVCLVVYYWDSIVSFISGKKGACACDECCEDFDEELLYEFDEGI